MADGFTILIGPRSLALTATGYPAAKGTELVCFPETEVCAAVEQIVARKPRVVVLPEKLAFSPRGTALTHRLSIDAALARTELVVIDASGRLTPMPPGSQTTWLPLDGAGTRRVPRIRIRDGHDVLVDGAPAALVNLSTLGAQVVSQVALKPRQRVRIVLGAQPAAIKAAGTVIWASFEIPKGTQAPQYRAGLEFVEADPEPLLQLCLQHAAERAAP